MPHADLIAHGEHVMTVCNACRYCEQFCPVFPAMESRLTFAEADLAYLANLCHNCGECLYACQYAPPHEFGINVPRTLAEIRAHSYEAYCWPSFLSSAFRRHNLLTGLVLAAGLIAVMVAAVLIVNEGVFPRPVGRRRLLRRPSSRRHGRALRRRGPVLCRCSLDRCRPVLARHAGRRGAQPDRCRSRPARCVMC